MTMEEYEAIRTRRQSPLRRLFRQLVLESRDFPKGSLDREYRMRAARTYVRMMREAMQ